MMRMPFRICGGPSYFELISDLKLESSQPFLGKIVTSDHKILHILVDSMVLLLERKFFVDILRDDARHMWNSLLFEGRLHFVHV